jgi:hypothetical protein
MKHLQRVAAVAAFGSVIVIGCQTTDSSTSTEEEVETTEQALFETTCTSAPATPLTVTTTGSCATRTTAAPAGATYGSTQCPAQYVVELQRANGSPFGSGYIFWGNSKGAQIAPVFSQAECEKENTTFTTYAYTSGVWTETGRNWYRGQYNTSTGYCFLSYEMTKVRVVKSEFTRTGTKGSYTDTTHPMSPIGVSEGC